MWGGVYTCGGGQGTSRRVDALNALYLVAVKKPTTSWEAFGVKIANNNIDLSYLIAARAALAIALLAPTPSLSDRPSYRSLPMQQGFDY